MMSPEGIVYFDTLDSKLKQLCTGIYRLDGELLAVLDVNQIKAIFPYILSTVPDSDKTFNKIFKEILAR